MSFLEVKEITMQFGGLTAVSQASFHVDKGEIVSLIGPNGAGKTTVFNMLTGVYRITSGEMTFEGQDLTTMTPQQIVKAGISRTFQNLRLFPKMRVVENVLVGPHIHTNYNIFDSLFRTPRYRKEEAEKEAKAVRNLKSIGLESMIHSFADSLPYGEQRKGVIKTLKKAYPQANIAAVDYDPGASEVNQLNRIKLMLSTARENLNRELAETV